MKTKLFTSLFLLSFLFLTTASYSQYATIAKDHPKYAEVEKNLIQGIYSSNEGLRFSCAYFLGEMKSENAVMPLVRMMREEDCCGARILAALSLIKIGDPQGIYMVKRTAEFNTEERVRKMSEKFYFAYLLQKYLEEHPEDSHKFAFLN